MQQIWLPVQQVPPQQDSPVAQADLSKLHGVGVHVPLLQ
jgi:hypothetical protein